MTATNGEARGALAGRIILVTGASRGIGGAAARMAAADGATVVALARTQGALEALDDTIRADGAGSAVLVPADLRKPEALDRLGAALFERYGRLDGLVAAAGMLGPISPAGQVKPKEWDRVVTVNLTANWRLIRAMDPLIRAAPDARAVFVTSTAARAPRAYWGAYAASKGGLEALALAYAAELENTPTRVNLLNPGATRTAMRAQAMPGENPETLPPPEHAARAIITLLDPSETRNGVVVDLRAPETAGA